MSTLNKVLIVVTIVGGVIGIISFFMELTKKPAQPAEPKIIVLNQPAPGVSGLQNTSIAQGRTKGVAKVTASKIAA